MNTNGKPTTPEYRLRTNRIHSKLKTLCHQWMVRNRPELVDRMRRQAKREVARG
jgi:hypothetical protein